MDPKGTAAELLNQVTKLHTELVQAARDLSKYRDLVKFVNDCLDFAETHFPSPVVSPWAGKSSLVPRLWEAATPAFAAPVTRLVKVTPALNTSGSSAAAEAFGYVVSNYKFVEDEQAREGFTALTTTYRTILARDQEKASVQAFLWSVSPEASAKFLHASAHFESLPKGEDPEGALVEMRSAVDLALRALLRLTPLSKAEVSGLKKKEWIPTIASHLAKDEMAKADLLLGSHDFVDLWHDLSSSKTSLLPPDVAAALIVQVTGLLNLMAQTMNPARGGTPQSA